MATCPNKNLDSWKNLVATRGENAAYVLWDMYNGVVPQEEYGPSQFQLNTQENINQAIKELDDYLLNFLKAFNVKTKEFEELKSRLGVDALGATDTLNKLIWYVKHRNEETIPEEAAHMLVMLMGENHPDIKELLNNIKNWEGYEQVKKDYLSVYQDEEKVKIEAVGKLIAKALVKNYKATGLNQTKLQEALRRILDFIESILDGLDFSSLFYYNQSIADHVAINVLSGNKDYIFKIKNLNKNLDAEKEINKNPLAKRIINLFSSSNVKMTGSLAIAGTENIRRPEGAGIHDVDFKVKSFKVYEQEILPKIPENAVPAHFGWHKKSYSTFAYMIPKEGYSIVVKNRKDDFSNGWITDYDVIDSSGNKVKSSQDVIMAVDFFVYKEGQIQKDFDYESKFIPASLVYEGKLSLGGKSNPYFFSRDKDQEDYVLRNPKSFVTFQKSIFYQLGKETPSEAMFQMEEMPSSIASPELISRVKELLKKMGVDIKALSEYAKEAKLDIKEGVNGLADLTRKLIAVAEGKEDVALTEEMVHIATAIIEQKNPKLVTEMISKIDRFKIYKQVYEQYKGVYLLPNGKPDIRKIKKEAVDKLISELIVYNNDGSTQFPELMEEENRSLVRTFWQKILDFFRGMYKSANIDIFQEAAAMIEEGVEGDLIDMEGDQIYYQVSDAQKAIQQRILETRDSIRKVVGQETTDPILMDTEEASNWYEIKTPDGGWSRIIKRVTDKVKQWYNQKFRGKTFTEEEKKFNEIKRKLGVKYHHFMEEIHGRYFNSDGTRKKNPDPRPSSFVTPVDEDVYGKLETYFTEMVERLSKDGTNPLVFSEVTVYDPKEKEAGTIDMLIVEPSGKAHILDWKFMSMAEGAKDVAWFKQGAYNIQLGRYKDILRDRYGVKEIGMNRAIPIIMKLERSSPKDPSSEMVIKGIAIGSVDPKKIEDVRLIPVSEQTESTGYKSLDELIRKLNAVYKKIESKKVSDDEEQEFKRDRLNILKEAIRVAQGTLNIAPLVDVIRLMRNEGDSILNNYKTIYEGRPANSQGEDFTDAALSGFAGNMREYVAFTDVFGRVDDLIGHLVYNKDMEKDAKSEEALEDIEMRKDLLSKIQEQARAIRLSSAEIREVSGKFADKFTGQRNLVTGLLSPEVIVKGLTDLFRGVSESAMASAQVLYKLVTNAKGRASRDALKEVDELMKIREKLSKRGGDLRKLVSQIYQKDKEGGFVNKLIYRYDKEFYEKIEENAQEGFRSKKWLRENIDIEAYKKEANELLEKKIKTIKKLYDDNPDMMDKLIKEERQKWNIERDDFTGWNNYILQRHPLDKWYSKEYLELRKDPELLELYDFISKINDKAKDVGYISNKVRSTFLPFIRKSMAESLAWDFDLSAIMNFGESLSIRTEDVGYGKIDEFTGELENAVPKYFTYDFTYKDGVNDYSDVSEDLFKNMILYINHMEKYKYLTEVEDQIKLVKDIETFKGHIVTDQIGEVVYIDGSPKEAGQGSPDGNENAKTFDLLMRAVLYEQKYPLSDSDTPLGTGPKEYIKRVINKLAGKEIYKPDENPSSISLVKSMETVNRGFQLKTLGLEFISGAVNAFGNNIQIATQSGNYFDGREVGINEIKLIGNSFKNDDEREMFVQLINTFLPMKDDPNYEKMKKAGMSALTRGSFSDMLFLFMREPEQHMEKSIFLTLLENMMVEDGKIVSIREYVKSKYKDRFDSAARYKEVASKIKEEIKELKKTRSINATKKLEDGKLVIPGLDLNNINELQRLTNLTRRISRNAAGGMSDGDVNKAGMNIWMRSMMVFKNWIPKLVETRFGEFRKVGDDFSVEVKEDGTTTGDKYDIGRIRLFSMFLSLNIAKTIKNINDIISVNENGLLLMDELYEKFALDYERRTGKPLNMDRDEFMDMIRTNLRNQVKELAILMSMFGAAISLGIFAPDDDDDRADKNFHRYAQRVVDKFIGELSFFYNPLEFQKLLSGSMFPAIGMFSDMGRFTNHFFMETTGIDFSNPELTVDEVRKKAQPVKNFGKMFPIAKSLFTYGAIIDSEFAKEYDITIQKESRR